jgi:hypothetical protein
MPPQTTDVFAFSSEDVLKGVSQQVFAASVFPVVGADVAGVSPVSAQTWAR